MTTSLDQVTVTELADVVRALSSSADPMLAYEAIDALLQRRVGYKLFTVLKYIAADEEVERSYSSNVTVYPPGGRKKKADTSWGRVVIDGGRPLISHNDADIEANFPDFETIRRLGIAGMINIPVVWGGTVVGSLNVSGDAGQFGESDIPVLTVIAGLLAPVLSRYQEGQRR